MADNNTRMEVEVSAIVNQADAEKAGKDLNKYVLNSFKDGYIKVPAEVEVEFNNASKELKKAHSEFVSQWKKMNSVGFDSSSTDVQKLTKKYEVFMEKMKTEGKYNTKQYKALKGSNFDTLLNTYSKELTTLKTRIKQQLLPEINKINKQLSANDEKVKKAKDKVRKANARLSDTSLVDGKTFKEISKNSKKNLETDVEVLKKEQKNREKMIALNDNNPSVKAKYNSKELEPRIESVKQRLTEIRNWDSLRKIDIAIAQSDLDKVLQDVTKTSSKLNKRLSEIYDLLPIETLRRNVKTI